MFVSYHLAALIRLVRVALCSRRNIHLLAYPIAMLVAVTLAPGITPMFGSTMVPSRTAVACA
jgi:hypothetical protein